MVSNYKLKPSYESKKIEIKAYNLILGDLIKNLILV